MKAHTQSQSLQDKDYIPFFSQFHTFQNIAHFRRLEAFFNTFGKLNLLKYTFDYEYLFFFLAWKPHHWGRCVWSCTRKHSYQTPNDACTKSQRNSNLPCPCW